MEGRDPAGGRGTGIQDGGRGDCDWGRRGPQTAPPAVCPGAIDSRRRAIGARLIEWPDLAP